MYYLCVCNTFYVLGLKHKLKLEFFTVVVRISFTPKAMEPMEQKEKKREKNLFTPTKTIHLIQTSFWLE